MPRPEVGGWLREAGRLLPRTTIKIRKQFLVDVGDEPLNEGRGRHLKEAVVLP